VNRLLVVSFGPVSPDLLDAIADPVWRSYDLEVHRRAERPIPADAWDAKRQQHGSEVLLRTLLVGARDPGDRLLGVTAVDLCIPMLSFVFGQAQLKGAAAVVSTARLDPSFYGLSSRPDLVRRRFIAEVIHEVGHTVGLVHCAERSCPMSLATAVEAIDQKGEELCDGCTALVHDFKAAGSLTAETLRRSSRSQ
jgi:archaemetzincin